MDTYAVEEAAGASHTAARLQLRQRVFVKQAHAGVTGDKKTTGITLFFCTEQVCAYFSYFPLLWSCRMRKIVANAVAHLKEENADQGAQVLKSQLQKLFCIHSDSAAQHFKSSKYLHWLSKQFLGLDTEENFLLFFFESSVPYFSTRALPLSIFRGSGAA